MIQVDHAARPAYRDPALPVASRVEDLLGRMTLHEKVGQLNQRLLGWHCWQRAGTGIRTTRLLEEEIERWGGLGAVYGLLRADAWSGRDWATGAEPALSAEVTARVQAQVVAGSRLGIPALFVEEATHGHLALGSQVFPVHLATAATWQPHLAEEAAAHIGREVRARGAHLALVSGADMLRDPRWGRAEETFGEDRLLASSFLRAFVRGMGRVPGLGVVIKHVAGQGAGMGGRNGSGSAVGWRELAEVHLAASRAGIEEGALGVMAAYNDIDGVPCIAHEPLLTGVLRERWGFRGIVMADLGAIDRLMRATSSAPLAGAMALRAGVDMSLCDETFTVLEEALDQGLVTEDHIDRATRRVLEVKVRLGLLDAADPPPEAPGGTVPTVAPGRAPAFPGPSAELDVAPSTLVLLQDHGGVLPLGRLPGSIAVIGPNAADVECLLGDYVPPLAPGDGVSVLDGFHALAPGSVSHEPGSRRTGPLEGGLERAARLASEAELVVLVLGATSVRSYDDDFQANGAGSLGGTPPAATTGEGFDVAEVELPAAQRDLVTAVADARRPGVPIIAVIVSGRPMGIGVVAERCDVVIYAWYPGPEGGCAIAGLVLGEREPTGRLPVSLPRSSGTLPVAYDERLEVTRRYVDTEARALFPFGAGLGYGRWRLGTPAVSRDEVTSTTLAGLRVEVSIANHGPRAGLQVVQLYARLLEPGVVPRRAVLVGYTRVHLEPGASRDVELAVERDALSGLGIGLDLPGGQGEDVRGDLELWCSIAGPGRRDDDVVRVRLA